VLRAEYEPIAARSYLIVSADRPLSSAAAIRRFPTPPDLCVKSPSAEAALTARIAFDGRYVRTVDEPLLAARRPGESAGDFQWRGADALRALYTLDTHLACVIFDALPSVSTSWLLLDGASLLFLAEDIERAATSVNGRPQRAHSS
jgi:hypothetical protein